MKTLKNLTTLVFLGTLVFEGCTYTDKARISKEESTKKYEERFRECFETSKKYGKASNVALMIANLHAEKSKAFLELSNIYLKAGYQDSVNKFNNNFSQSEKEITDFLSYLRNLTILRNFI